MDNLERPATIESLQAEVDQLRQALIQVVEMTAKLAKAAEQSPIQSPTERFMHADLTLSRLADTLKKTPRR